MVFKAKPGLNGILAGWAAGKRFKKRPLKVAKNCAQLEHFNKAKLFLNKATNGTKTFNCWLDLVVAPEVRMRDLFEQTLEVLQVRSIFGQSPVEGGLVG